MDVVGHLRAARTTFEAGDWKSCFTAWSHADPAALGADDLLDFGTAAFLVGYHDTCVDSLQRAFQARVDAAENEAAVECAFLLSMIFAMAGEGALAGGWAARAEHLLESLASDVPAHGYVAFLQMFRHLGMAAWPEAAACASRTVEAARRCDEPDLLALGLAAQGRMLFQAGEVPEGLARFDEAMVLVMGGKVRPVLAGHAYCVVIEGCQEVGDLGRAAEWTEALHRWCASQPGLVAFTGQSAVHRTPESCACRGAYGDALDELDGAVRRYLASGSPVAAGLAWGEHGDVLRLLGRYPEAEASYERAAGFGYEPQPGLALLWQAQGRGGAAVGAARRLLGEVTEPITRSRVLPAAVDILLANADRDGARAAADELGRLASEFGTGCLQASSAYAAGTAQLALGDAAGALPYLRKAFTTWRTLLAPYEMARTRVTVGRCLDLLGDRESAAVEWSTARRSFVELGAAPMVAELDRLTTPAVPPDGLTLREVEVLRLVAGGRSNAQIAADLVLSEKTVARHLSNIFTKIAVGSRTQAAAYAFERSLV